MKVTLVFCFLLGFPFFGLAREILVNDWYFYAEVKSKNVFPECEIDKGDPNTIFSVSFMTDRSVVLLILRQAWDKEKCRYTKNEIKKLLKNHSSVKILGIYGQENKDGLKEFPNKKIKDLKRKKGYVYTLERIGNGIDCWGYFRSPLCCGRSLSSNPQG